MSFRAGLFVVTALGLCAACSKPAPKSVAPAPSAPAKQPAISRGDITQIIHSIRDRFVEERGDLIGRADRLTARVDGACDISLTAFLPSPSGAHVAPVFRMKPGKISVGGEQIPDTCRAAIDERALSIDRGSVRERWTNEGSAFEQTWAFSEKPRSGGIDVRVAVSGLSLEQSGAAGLTFRDASTGLGILYGHATFVDALGTKTEVPARFASGELRFTVPEDVVQAASFPAVLDPFISAAPLQVDAPVTTSDVSGEQRFPAIAGNGSKSLLVWEDTRNPATGSDIWGAFIDFNGSPVAQTQGGFVISSAAGAQRNPVVTGDTSDFYVAWQDERTTPEGDIYGTKVLVDGTVVSPSGVAISTASGAQMNPTIAWEKNSKRILVAFEDSNSPSSVPPPGTVQGAVFDDTFAPVGSSFTIAGICQAVGSCPHLQPSATAIANDTVFVAWLDGRVGSNQMDVYGARVSMAGTTPGVLASDANGIPIAAGLNVAISVQIAHALPMYSNSALVAYVEKSGSSVFIASAQQIDATGALVGSATQLYTVNGGTTGVGLQRPAVIHTTDRYTVVVPETAPTGAYGALRRFHVPPLAAPAPIMETPRSANVRSPALGNSSNNNAFIAWEEQTATGDLRGTTLTSVPFTDGGIYSYPVLLGSNRELETAVGGLGDQAFVAWSDYRDPTTAPDIWGARVTFDAGVLDIPPLAIATTAANEHTPVVTASPDGYLVGWTSEASNTSSTVRLINSDGGFVAGALSLGTTTNAGHGMYGAAWDGAQYLVLFEQGGALRALRISPNGTVIGSTGAVGLTSGTRGALSRSKDVALAAFLTSSGVNGSIVRSDGGLSIGTPFSISPVGVSVVDPSAASDGTDFLVAWNTTVFRGPPVGTINAATVSAGGTVGTPFMVAPDAGTQSAASVVFDGQRYVVLWDELPTYASGVALGSSTELRGRYFDVTGAPIGEPFIVFAGGPFVRRPSSTSNGDDRILVGFADYSTQAASERALLTTLRYQLVRGERCAADADCQSGFCVDGVCCATACGGSEPTDCQACSVAAGGSTDGTCTFLQPDHVCRPENTAAGCDVAETCTGSSAACPPDAIKPPGELCRAAVGECDAPELCTGKDAGCPEDLLFNPDHICRDSAGICDAVEKCDSASAACPPDLFAGPDSICRTSTGSCDVDETCTGTSVECPGDQFAPDNTSCIDVANGVCRAGACVNLTETTHYGLIHCGCGSTDGVPLIFGIAIAALVFRRRRSARAGLIVLLVVGVVGAARAEDEQKEKLSYLGLKAGAGISVSDADSLSSYVQSQLSKLDVYDVIGQSEIAAIIGQERQKSLLSCSDEQSSCLAEIAGALNAERIVNGDIAVVGETTILNLSLIDSRDAKLIKRVSRKVEGTSPDALLDQIPSAVVEMAEADPKLKGKEIHVERGFGGVVAGFRGDGDVVGKGISPGVTAELSGRHLGGAVTLLVGYGAASNGTNQVFPGLRAEGRFFPVELGIVRPYLALGATVFAPDVSGRGALGLAVRLGSVQIFGDAAYERFFNSKANNARFKQDAVLIGAGAGWAF